METFRPEWGHNQALIAVGLAGRLNYTLTSIDKYLGLQKAWIRPEIILGLKYVDINMVHNKAKEKESWTDLLYEARDKTRNLSEHNIFVRQQRSNSQSQWNTSTCLGKSYVFNIFTGYSQIIT